MLIEERHAFIRNRLQSDGSVTVEQLRNDLGISPMTVWRDLAAMEAKGEAKRVRGGAIATGVRITTEPYFSWKKGKATEEKEAIATLCVQKWIQPGDSLSVEGGTTAAAVVQKLEGAGITVLTNSLEIVRAASPAISLICSGGVLRNVSRTFVGPQAEQFFETYKTDKCLLSCTGFDFEAGLTDPNPMEIQVKRAMLENTKQIILLLDSTKYGQRSLMPVWPWEKVSVLITDSNMPEEVLVAFRDRGIPVEVAPLPPQE